MILIVVREAEMAVHALGRAGELLRFPPREVDFDDSLLVNDLVEGWCRTQELGSIRPRACRE